MGAPRRSGAVCPTAIGTLIAAAALGSSGWATVTSPPAADAPELDDVTLLEAAARDAPEGVVLLQRTVRVGVSKPSGGAGAAMLQGYGDQAAALGVRRPPPAAAAARGTGGAGATEAAAAAAAVSVAAADAAAPSPAPPLSEPAAGAARLTAVQAAVQTAVDLRAVASLGRSRTLREAAWQPAVWALLVTAAICLGAYAVWTAKGAVERATRAAIEQGAARLPGGAASVEGLRVHLLGRAVHLEAVAIRNPPGCGGEYLLKAGRVRAKFSLRRLLSSGGHEAEVSELEMGALQLLVEFDGHLHKTNTLEVLEYLRAMATARSASTSTGGSAIAACCGASCCLPAAEVAAAARRPHGAGRSKREVAGQAATCGGEGGKAPREKRSKGDVSAPPASVCAVTLRHVWAPSVSLRLKECPEEPGFEVGCLEIPDFFKERGQASAEDILGSLLRSTLEHTERHMRGLAWAGHVEVHGGLPRPEGADAGAGGGYNAAAGCRQQ